MTRFDFSHTEVLPPPPAVVVNVQWIKTFDQDLVVRLSEFQSNTHGEQIRQQCL